MSTPEGAFVFKYKLITSISILLFIVGCANSNGLSGLPISNLGVSSIFVPNGSTYDLIASKVRVNFGYGDQEMLAYNKSIPGPAIFVQQGSKIFLNFKNDLGQDSSLHSHGVRVNNRFDGVPGITQDEIKPGETFRYELTFPDVGVFFYHPHTREDYQQDAGLYGAFVVMPNSIDVNEFGVDLDLDHELVFLDDVEVSNRGKIELSKFDVVKTLMGRFGNRMLINGQMDQILDWSDLTSRGSVVVTFINTANVRPYNLRVEGAKMELIADDASAFQNFEEVDSLIIGPSERLTVKFTFNQNDVFRLYSQADFGNPKYIIAQADIDTFLSTDEVVTTPLDFDISLLNKLENIPVSKKLELDMKMFGVSMNHMSMPCHQMPGGSWMGDCESDLEDGSSFGFRGIEFEDEMPMMNDNSDLSNVDWIIRDVNTGLEGGEIEWNFKKGEYVKISVKNKGDSMHPMQHPFHVHGQRFLVLTKNGVKNNNLAWQDTVLIPSGDIYEILIEMSNPGEWLIHCHIPEHMEAGMMMKFWVD